MSCPDLVVDVHTLRDAEDIRKIFSSCGPIIGFHPWKTAKSPKNHFFIEFARRDGVERAKEVVRRRYAGTHHAGIQLHALAANETMHARYRAMVRRGGGGEPSLKRQRVDDGASAVEAIASSTVVAHPHVSSPRHDFAPPMRRDGRPAPSHRRELQCNSEASYRSDRAPQTFARRHNHNHDRSMPRRDLSRIIASPPPSTHHNSYSSYDYRRSRSISSARGHRYSPPPQYWSDRREPTTFEPPRREDALLVSGPDSIASTCISPNPTFIARSPPPAGLTLTCPKTPALPVSPPLLTADSGISFIPPSCSDIYSKLSAVSSPEVKFASSIEQAEPAAESPLVSLYSASGPESIDMAKLDPNPTTIIESLKKWQCGPEMWMMVGAHYRRVQLPEAAVQVMTVMLEVMNALGHKDSDFKPAFLLLAQCNYEIARQRAKTPQAQESEKATHERFLSTLEWLRQTYGANAGQASPAPRTRIPTGPRKRDASCLDSDTRSQPHTDESHGPSSPNSRRIQSLQSELNLIRSSQVISASVLESTRKEKHTLQDELEEHRSKQRRLERRLLEAEDSCESARTAARKAEEDRALEERARRLAEEQLVEERRAWAKRECTVREEASKAVLGDLASVFARAAQAPSSLWAAADGNLSGPSILGNHQ